MAGSKANGWRWNGPAAAFLIAAALFVAPGSHAQLPVARSVNRPYQRPVIVPPAARPAVPRPMPVRPMVYAQPIAVPRVAPPSMPRVVPARRYVVAAQIPARTYTLYTLAQPAFAPLGFQPRFQPNGAWRAIGPRGLFNLFLFGSAYVPDYGYWQIPSNYQMLPLGFGLWPACDSAAIPGRFWTIGPCMGMGDYQSLALAYQNEFAMENAQPPYYQAPVVIFEQPEPSTSGAAQPNAPAVTANMVICLTDGRQIEVSDWWVTEGRFFFIPVKGKTESVDLDALDLKKTIETDEQRGRTFMLNFTPPDQRPVLPALPAN